MATLVLMASDKGGVGKTTTSVNMAVYLCSKGKKVILIKAGKDKALITWDERRREQGYQSIPVIDGFGDITKAINKAEKMADIVIIDCPGFDNPEYRTALTLADIFITPLKPSSVFESETITEVSETVLKARQLGNKDLKAYVLFTRVKHTRVQAASELTKELRSDKAFIQPLKNRIAELDVFENCANVGVGVHEVERASSLAKAKAQIELVAKEVGLIK
ncbi:AAA family ATPase [Pantoea ananatis]|uniref:AAA family ATPase n=1 Tax=Pantoea ananas TaxID=553 RepID=UPI001B309B3B|nr:AAA family ATPase [Pantoea ananatis]